MTDDERGKAAMCGWPASLIEAAATGGTVTMKDGRVIRFARAELAGKCAARLVAADGTEALVATDGIAAVRSNP